MPVMGAKLLTTQMLLHVATIKCMYRKQARRTGMAGPLGEMFDHGKHNIEMGLGGDTNELSTGCDAINTTLEVILCLRALDLTRSWWTVASVMATAANFYLTTWEEFHTGSYGCADSMA